MKRSTKFRLLRLAVLGWVVVALGTAFGADDIHYVVTNDDVPIFIHSSATVYTVGTDGLLTMKEIVSTGKGGIAGGYFAANRVVVLDRGSQQCVFASQATTGEIDGIVVRTLTTGGHANGSKKDTGSSNGIGLAVNSKYLYASFTDSSNIGTFQLHSGCKISFVGDTKVGGLQGGVIDGMAVHGNILVATYGDGSIESFDTSAGKPVSNSDKQNATGWHGGINSPSGVDITKDGHFALFGDTSTSTVVEVSDISSGKLAPTVVYHLGKGINSSNILLSPDETLLYISNNQGGKISAAFFDKSTGKLTKGCTSGFLGGYVANWSYLASMALHEASGTGGTIYVAEYGNPSSIGEIEVKSANGNCTLTESPQSPAADPNSPGLLSIGAFPPRPF